MSERNRNELSEIQKTALDAVVDYHISHEARGTPIAHVILQGPDEDAQEFRAAAMSLVRSGVLEAAGLSPNWTLFPTWMGLLLSSKAQIVEHVANKLLVFFKNRIKAQGVDFKQYTLAEAVANDVIARTDPIYVIHAVIHAFDLSSGANMSGGPSPSATWSTPRDIVDFRGFKGIRELQIRVQLKRYEGPSPPVASPEPAQPTRKLMTKNPKDVFVVHGRDEAVRLAMFDFLRAVGLHPMEFEEARKRTNKASPFIGEILNVAFSEAQAVVVVFSGDDEAMLRSALHGTSEPTHETNLTRQARQNVLFEAGMAIGRDEDHTILVEIGNNLRPLSDIAGRHTVRMTTGGVAERMKLVDRLRTAKCAVDTDGKADWLTGPYFARVFGP